MNKRKLVYYFSLGLLISSLLPIIDNNIPILASYRWLWAPAFILYALVFEKNNLVQKQVLMVLLYGIIYVWPIPSILWPYASEWYKEAIFEDFYGMLVPVLLFTVFYNNKYWDTWIKLSKLSIIFIIITGVMTIIATSIEPLIVRDSYSSGKFEITNFDSIFRLGFGSYGYMTAIVSVFPVIIYFLKKRNEQWLNKWMLISLMIFLFIVLLTAQIFANILVAFITILFSFLGASKFKKSFFYILIFFIIFFFTPKTFYIKSLKGIGQNFEQNSELYLKFNDMANYIENPVLDEDDFSTETSVRASRYPSLFKVFLASPLLGDANHKSPFEYELKTGGHLYWMSRLALWGIFGFMGYIIILINVFKPVTRMVNEELRFYYYISVAAIFTLGLFKNLTGREIYIISLFVLPGLFLIRK